MKNRSLFVYVRYVAAVCCVCLLAATLGGCEFGTLSSRSLENPKQAIVDFIEAMQAEEFDAEAAEAAAGYIGNYSTMGFEKYTMLEGDTLEKTIFDMLRDSYSVEFADDDLSPISSPYQGVDMNVSGKQAFVTLTFTSLDLEMMSEPLEEAVSQIGAERMYEGETYESEESALVLVEEIFPTVFDADDMSEYCVQREMTIELNHRDDGWKISVSEEFYDALLGR